MTKQLLISIRITIILLLLVSGVYPLVVWGISQVAFKHQADGSLVKNAQGHVVGSALLAQSFTLPQYFQPRPSAAGSGYDPTQSGGTNLGPTSAKLINGVKDLAAAYRTTNGLAPNALVPVDAVTRSGSGLDPDISILNAQMQAARVAKARGVPITDIQQMVSQMTQSRQLGFLGQPCVNVLMLNLALNRSFPMISTKS